MNETLLALAQALGPALRKHGWRAVTAESCTGGLVAMAITEVPGSSAWFERGFVTYSNEAKMELLGVEAATLAAHGAVSEETVLEMARGALQHAHADIAVAISGVAGPDGGSAAKPVGTVCLAWAVGTIASSVTLHFPGDRQAVRLQAAQAALQGLLARC